MKQVIIFDEMGISGALGHNALDLSELNMCNAFHVMIDCKWSRCMAALFAVILTKSAQTPMAPIKTSFKECVNQQNNSLPRSHRQGQVKVNSSLN